MGNRKRRYSDKTISENQATTARADKSKILDNMRHDIRSPMHVVKGLSSVLAASDPLTTQQKEIVATLKSNVDDLFTQIRYERGSKVPVASQIVGNMWTVEIFALEIKTLIAS